jgi:carboxyl-terminal processing protease
MGKQMIWLPMMLAISIVGGIYLGTKLNYPSKPTSLISANIREKKIKQIINYIEYEYVDEVNTDSLLDMTITDMLRKLDPHSTYIANENVQRAAENIQGSFDGIGIEFQVYRDSLTVVKIIPTGPAAKAGLKAGDRIIGIDGTSIIGEGSASTDFVGRLKGPRGTAVVVKIWRPLEDKTLDFKIIRDKIPLVSLDAAHIVQDDIGLIRLNRFAETTYDEYMSALKQLKQAGMKRLILDLRDNPGGLLAAAINISDEFLTSKQLIVYTEDRNNRTRYTYAKSRGAFLQGDIVILINEGSASASEVIAGALQDNDRAWIVGRRSFGKGLVQEEMALPDGSKVRLTTARYFTPTGRSIQKPYEGDYKAYQSESFQRFERGELLNPDSIKVREDLKFTTPGGRVVFGGGGIVPDFFVPIDTSSSLTWLYHILGYGRIDQFAFAWVDDHRRDFADMAPATFISTFEVDEEMLNAFINQTNIQKYQSRVDEITKMYIKVRIKALMARNLFGNAAFYEVLHQSDPMVNRALEILNQPEKSAKPSL